MTAQADPSMVDVEYSHPLGWAEGVEPSQAFLLTRTYLWIEKQVRDAALGAVSVWQLFLALPGEM